MITALNKIDKLTEAEAKAKFETMKEKTRNPILISGLKSINLDALRKEILKKLEGYVQVSFTVPLKNETMQLMSLVYSKADVKKADYTNNSVQVVFEAEPEFTEKVKKRVEELNGKLENATTPAG